MTVPSESVVSRNFLLPLFGSRFAGARALVLFAIIAFAFAMQCAHSLPEFHAHAGFKFSDASDAQYNAPVVSSPHSDDCLICRLRGQSSQIPVFATPAFARLADTHHGTTVKFVRADWSSRAELSAARGRAPPALLS